MGREMRTGIKYQILLILIALGMGALAGFIVINFDLSWLQNYALIIVAILMLASFALIALAYRRGRIPA